MAAIERLTSELGHERHWKRATERWARPGAFSTSGSPGTSTVHRGEDDGIEPGSAG